DVAAEKPLNGRPLPDLAAVLLDQRDFPKLAASDDDGLLSRHAKRNQLLGLLVKMLLDLFREITVEAAAQKQLLQPIHDSPGARTRVIPSSIVSKRDISFFRCFAPGV